VQITVPPSEAELVSSHTGDKQQCYQHDMSNMKRSYLIPSVRLIKVSQRRLALSHPNSILITTDDQYKTNLLYPGSAEKSVSKKSVQNRHNTHTHTHTSSTFADCSCMTTPNYLFISSQVSSNSVEYLFSLTFSGENYGLVYSRFL
jgi:hypothetical protein